jgi:glycosyltransferase involved in cell wall biosynthesis
LQGDDIFLNALHAADRDACIRLIQANCVRAAGLIATSANYADRMALYLGLPRGRIRVIPPGINLKGHGGERVRKGDRPVVGFFSRLAPEKGLHHLVDAFVELRNTRDAVLAISGWHGPQHEAYLNKQKMKHTDIQHIECPGHAEKVAFLNRVDVFALPTVYEEPKGLPVLEAWANGVPVVLPEHGCFPELIADTSGGVLVPPNNPTDVATAIATLLDDPAAARRLGEAGRAAVQDRYTHDAMARNTLCYLREFVPEAA